MDSAAYKRALEVIDVLDTARKSAQIWCLPDSGKNGAKGPSQLVEIDRVRERVHVVSQSGRKASMNYDTAYHRKWAKDGDPILAPFGIGSEKRAEPAGDSNAEVVKRLERLEKLLVEGFSAQFNAWNKVHGNGKSIQLSLDATKVE